MLMGDEAFKTKKNEPTHVSLHCLEEAVCCIMYCNSWPELPAQCCGRDVRRRWMRVLGGFWLRYGKKTSVVDLWVLIYSAMARKQTTTTQSPLKSHTKKKTKVLSAACRESKWNYHPNKHQIRVQLIEAASTWTGTENRCWHGSWHFLLTRLENITGHKSLIWKSHEWSSWEKWMCLPGFFPLMVATSKHFPTTSFKLWMEFLCVSMKDWEELVNKWFWKDF